MFDKLEFWVTTDHILLLQRMNIGFIDYIEFGAPAVDPKRPYGSSDVYCDIAEILGILPDDGEEFSGNQRGRMDEIHNEMKTVLQILVKNLSIEEGKYECRKYIEDWRAV